MGMVCSATQVFSVMLLSYKLLTQGCSKGQYIILAIFGLLAAFISLQAKSFYFVWIWFFAASSRNENLANLARIAIVVISSLVMMVLIGDLVGITEGIQFDGARDRYSWGFLHPNRLGLYSLEIVIAWLVYKFNRIKMIDVLGIILLSLITFQMSGSRTASITAIFAIGVFLFAQWMNNKHRKIGLPVTKYAFVILICVMAASSIWLMIEFTWNSNAMVDLNGILSGRPMYANRYYELYPPNLLGQDVTLLAQSYGDVELIANPIMVDNAYALCVIKFGYLSAAIYFLLYVCAVIHQAKYDITAMSCALMSCAFLGLSEAYMLDASFNYFFPLACGCLLFGHGITSGRPDGKHYRR